MYVVCELIKICALRLMQYTVSNIHSCSMQLEVMMEKNEQMQFHHHSRDQAGHAPYRTERGDQDAYLDGKNV